MHERIYNTWSDIRSGIMVGLIDLQKINPRRFESHNLKIYHGSKIPKVSAVVCNHLNENHVIFLECLLNFSN
jgi:hypothetical protein